MSIEIELITTKKKLTKSIVNQMEWMKLVDFNIVDGKNYDTVLGYYIDKSEPIAIVKVIDDYKRIVLRNWRPATSRPELICKNAFWSFNSFDELESIFTKYSKLKERALSTHIYI